MHIDWNAILGFLLVMITFIIGVFVAAIANNRAMCRRWQKSPLSFRWEQRVILWLAYPFYLGNFHAQAFLIIPLVAMYLGLPQKTGDSFALWPLVAGALFIPFMSSVYYLLFGSFNFLSNRIFYWR